MPSRFSLSGASAPDTPSERPGQRGKRASFHAFQLLGTKLSPSETGLYYLQSRYYNPEEGRFINADGQLNPGTGLIGLNLFAYCNNNPVNMIDPDGHIPFLAITAAIGAIGGAIVGGIIAAKNGGNVWAGIGIGAAAGGLIGLGAGAAASAMLAGSVLATTAEVKCTCTQTLR